MRLDDGWNQIQFNLSDFTRRAYGTNYIETLRVQVLFPFLMGTPNGRGDCALPVTGLWPLWQNSMGFWPGCPGHCSEGSEGSRTHIQVSAQIYRENIASKISLFQESTPTPCWGDANKMKLWQHQWEGFQEKQEKRKVNHILSLKILHPQIHANCRIRRVYFSDRLYSEDELPAEFKLYLPVQNKAKVSRPSSEEDRPWLGEAGKVLSSEFSRRASPCWHGGWSTFHPKTLGLLYPPALNRDQSCEMFCLPLSLPPQGGPAPPGGYPAASGSRAFLGCLPSEPLYQPQITSSPLVSDKMAGCYMPDCCWHTFPVSPKVVGGGGGVSGTDHLISENLNWCLFFFS